MCSYESLNIQKLNLLSQKAFQAFMTWTKDHDLGLNHNGHIPDREKGGPKHCLGVTPYLFKGNIQQARKAQRCDSNLQSETINRLTLLDV